MDAEKGFGNGQHNGICINGSVNYLPDFRSEIALKSPIINLSIEYELCRPN